MSTADKLNWALIVMLVAVALAGMVFAAAPPLDKSRFGWAMHDAAAVLMIIALAAGLLALKWWWAL